VCQQKTAWLCGERQHSLARNDWPTGIKGGHDLAFAIEIADMQASESRSGISSSRSESKDT
jgi:hypothetical protein